MKESDDIYRKFGLFISVGIAQLHVIVQAFDVAYVNSSTVHTYILESLR